MDNDELLYIEDAKKRKLFYRFTPAAFISNFVPLVVVLHGKDGAGATHFEHKMWNVLTPLDSFTDKKNGAYWLGEEGDFFVKDLLQSLIRQISQECECEDHIYLYGSGMGGYGAILHGVLCKANAVYAHTPQVRLRGTGHKEYDLSSLLNDTDPFPIFYLCGIEKNSAEDDMASFIDACKRHDIKFKLEYCEKDADEVQNLKKVLNFFERMVSMA